MIFKFFLTNTYIPNFTSVFGRAAVADKKNFYHSFVSPYFAPKEPILQGFPGL